MQGHQLYRHVFVHHASFVQSRQNQLLCSQEASALGRRGGAFRIFNCLARGLVALDSGRDKNF